jgi:hypothetical protein
VDVRTLPTMSLLYAHVSNNVRNFMELSNKQSHTADEGLSSSLGVGHKANNSSP